MISSQLKDSVLSYLWSNKDSDYQIDVDYYDDQLAASLQTSGGTIKQLVEYFERRNFLKREGYSGGAYLTMFIETHDFLASGAFTVEDELIDKNLNKLNLEIKSLEASIPKDKVELVSGLISSIIGTWTLLHGIK